MIGEAMSPAVLGFVPGVQTGAALVRGLDVVAVDTVDVRQCDLFETVVRFQSAYYRMEEEAKFAAVVVEDVTQGAFYRKAGQRFANTRIQQLYGALVGSLV